MGMHGIVRCNVKKRLRIFFLLAGMLVMTAGCASSDGVAGSYHCIKVEQIGDMTIDQTDNMKDHCSLELKSNGEATVTLQGITTAGSWEEEGDQVSINGGEMSFYKDDDGDLSLVYNEGLFTYNYMFSK